ncbi:MAG: MerR family transcriptional regulator [Thermomicrobiales bacterium]
MEKLLTPADVARILGIVPATVRALALSGQLEPAVTTERGMRLFRRSDVERLAAVREAKRADSSGRSTPPGTEEEFHV